MSERDFDREIADDMARDEMERLRAIEEAARAIVTRAPKLGVTTCEVVPKSLMNALRAALAPSRGGGG